MINHGACLSIFGSCHSNNCNKSKFQYYLSVLSLKIYMEILKVKIELVMKIYCFELKGEFYLTCKSNF